MAWFDILGGALEGAQQGVANAQQLFLTKRELDDRRRRELEEQRRTALAEQRALAEDTRRKEEFAATKQARALTEVAQLLQMEDPRNLDPASLKALSAQGPEYARAVQQLVRVDGGTYTLRMDPLAAQRRELETSETAAKAELQKPEFKNLPYAEQVAVMNRAGLDERAQYRMLSPENKAQFRKGGGAGLEADLRQEQFEKELSLRAQELGLRRNELAALTRYRDRAARTDEDTANRNYYLGLAKLLADAEDDRARKVGAAAGAYMRANPGKTPEEYQQAFLMFAQMMGMATAASSGTPPMPVSPGKDAKVGVFTGQAQTPGSD